MKPLDLALQYMDSFFGEKPIEELATILDEHCSFVGPFHTSDTADAYIASLQKSPPDNVHYEIIRAYQDVNSACIIYQFLKSDISTPMAQLFEVRNEKICSIQLIFDTGVFR